MNITSTRGSLSSTAAILALTLLPLGVNAASVATTVIAPSISGSGNFNLVPITGLDQFDPSNGTLTGISFTLGIASFDIDISLGGWEDPGTGATFDYADLYGQISLDVAKPGGGGLLFSTTSFGDTIFDEFDSVNSTGPFSPPATQDATARLIGDDLFDGFIGTGEVSNMSWGVFAFGHPELVALSDGSFAYGDPQIDSFSAGPATITIDYTYTPAEVPLPAAAWLFISALGGLGVIKRRR